MTVVGIGAGSDSDRVISSIHRQAHPERIICYCCAGTRMPEDPPFQVKRSQTPGEDMVRDLSRGVLNAAIRGTLSAHETLTAIKEIFQVTELERIVLLTTAEGKTFLFSPVGIDEGNTLSQKISLIHKSRDLAHTFGLPDTVGILSGGRLGDIGRNPKVDRSLADGELLSRITGGKHYEILIEDAVASSGIVIAPDGISGNLIFRSLLFLGNTTSHGALVANISRIFIDTSRVNPDYTNALLLATRLL